MKVLLFGANGQLGRELQRSLAPLGELVALERGSTGFCGDLTDLAGIANTVRNVKPDVVVNAAAYTAVDRAESDVDAAHLVNALAPGALAEAASAEGALMVHYSTDYVFNGSGSTPWHEGDATGPLNVYGRTKLEGEQRVAAACAKHLIFRSGWVYSARGDSFIKTILQKVCQPGATQQEPLAVVEVVNDQFGAPTGANLLADVTAHATKHMLLHPGSAGLYHVAAGGETTWFDYANHAVDQLIRARAAPEIIVNRIQPVSSVEWSSRLSAAERPKNSRLNTTKLQQTFGLYLPHWQVGVNRLLAEIEMD